MMRWAILLGLIALLNAGCGGPENPERQAAAQANGQPSQPEVPVVAQANGQPAQPAAPAVAQVTGQPSQPKAPAPAPVPAQPEVEIFPAVPRHPAAAEHQIDLHQRASMIGKGDTAAQVLAWYAAELPGRGWKAEPTALPADKVLLFSKDGEYLSISGHDLTSEMGTLLWFHLRPTREVAEAQAIQIAASTHRTELPWSPEFFPEFETERYGAGVKHPVWALNATAPRSLVTVWVNAITAEAFRIMQASDY